MWGGGIGRAGNLVPRSLVDDKKSGWRGHRSKFLREIKVFLCPRALRDKTNITSFATEMFTFRGEMALVKYPVNDSFLISTAQV